MDKISVIMPAYNCERYITKAIDSVLLQKHQNFELLIADDASTDKTRKIIDNYSDSRIRTFHNTANIGYLKTCNKLFVLAVGNYITFQDADDFSSPDRLILQLKAFTDDPMLGMCGSNFSFVDVYDNIEFTSEFPCDYETIKQLIPGEFPFCGATLMIKKEVYETIGNYNEFFDRMGCEDFYWLARIVEKFKSINLRQNLYFYRHNPGSISRNITNSRNFHSLEIVKFLINQRKKTGSDALENHDYELLNNLINDLNRPFVEDKSLIYKKLANRAFEKKNYTETLINAAKAINAAPFQLYNIRTFFYYLRIISKRKLSKP